MGSKKRPLLLGEKEPEGSKILEFDICDDAVATTKAQRLEHRRTQNLLWKSQRSALQTRSMHTDDSGDDSSHDVQGDGLNSIHKAYYQKQIPDLRAEAEWRKVMSYGLVNESAAEYNNCACSLRAPWRRICLQRSSSAMDYVLSSQAHLKCDFAVTSAQR